MGTHQKNLANGGDCGGILTYYTGKGQSPYQGGAEVKKKKKASQGNASVRADRSGANLKDGTIKGKATHGGRKKKMDL